MLTPEEFDIHVYMISIYVQSKIVYASIRHV